MTFGRSPRGKFVFQKVNKIRWRPSQTQSGRISGTHFVTGSWDDEVSWPFFEILIQFADCHF